MNSTFRGGGARALALTLRTAEGFETVVLPIAAAGPHKVSGAGLRRRQATSLPKGRAAKGRFAGSAGKLRP